MDGHTHQLDILANYSLPDLTMTCLDYILYFCICFPLKTSLSGVSESLVTTIC